MTNDTEPHLSSAEDELAAIAAVPPPTETPPTTDSTLGSAPEAPAEGSPAVAMEPSAEASPAPPAPAEPAPPSAPSFDDLGLHPDVRLALDDMGYFAPT